ncbi:hypothetical protein BDA96_08G052200 [Sorghum bicolor]|uniref:TFIIS N-terminal domain-containing protein n=2 Tax=Sorghum bicolor TaxID=4558 RepID=A0A921QFQ6_SORBI|nr:probable mediator of RNA polymerase II transcription subunit 26c [Sorghum bicolor]EES16705.1 hypothetical protein SORBI_3008G048300 [Sorghum bicolor]KAG0520190.1 hypothetical protein BDA96_08G052200 [Sorghum bicolor]|eukprot:XP_002442867.1 probable mediator of RNA polymerase II transcription subunit 26c [Sorghum bicolor]
MSSDGRLRRALAAFGSGSDVWDLVDAALAAAARDSPAELRARRDGIVQRLYAGSARCRNCDADAPPPPAAQPNGAVAAAPAAASPASPDEEVDADSLDDEEEADAGVESKILAIKDFLEDPDQSEDEMVSLLQNLADMDITYKALQDTDIGRHVNGLRKHPSSEVRQLVKLLVRKWKEIVDDWVRLHNSGGDVGGSIISDGDSPDKVQPKYHQNTHASDFKYSSSPQSHNVLSSERSSNHNLVESAVEKRRTSPAPAYHNTKQNNSNNYPAVSSSAPARAMREQKNTLLDSEKLDSARKRLQENYQEAQNAKKQRTIQVMDIHDIPKPKNRNTFIRKSGGGGFPAKHR